MKKVLTSILVILGLVTSGYTQTYISETIQYDGETREYEIYVPAIYDGTTSVPLIFNFHGGNGTIADQISIGDMSSMADTANFIAVYPQALTDPNDGGSTNWIHKDPTTVDDVYFIDVLIDSIANDYIINLDRVYACGYSLGGEFTFELGCRLNNRIAAIGVVARTMQKYTYDNCNPVHPTGVLTILGTADVISDYNGVWWGGVQYYMSANETHDLWVSHNNCAPSTSTSIIPDINTGDGSTVERNTWSTPSECAYVEELKVIGGGHDWPGSFGNMDIDATQEIWQFLSRYDVNGLIGCVTTSLNENNSIVNNYKVYPNPFNDQITIEIKLPEETEYKIYSILGELLITGVFNDEVNKIDLSSLSQNIYILRMDNQSIKLIKSE